MHILCISLLAVRAKEKGMPRSNFSAIQEDHINAHKDGGSKPPKYTPSKSPVWTPFALAVSHVELDGNGQFKRHPEDGSVFWVAGNQRLKKQTTIGVRNGLPIVSIFMSVALTAFVHHGRLSNHNRQFAVAIAWRGPFRPITPY